MRHVFISLCFVWIFPVSAQLNGKYIFKHIGVKDGLLHADVQDISQDERGFMWIVTPNGLQRYDGYRFVNYPEAVNYPLDVDPFYKISMDTAKHRVNMVVQQLMQSLDLHTNKITTIKIKDRTETTFPDQITVESQENYKRVYSDDGIWEYKQDTLFNAYLFSDREKNSFLIRDPVSGEIFILMESDFGAIRKGTSVMERMRDDQTSHPLMIQLRQMEQDLQKRNLPFLNKLYFQIAKMDSHHNLWIIPWNEYMLRYDLEEQKLYFYDLQQIRDRQIRDRSGDPVMRITQVYEDHQRNLWFAIENGGIALYNREQDDFQFITADPRIKDGLEYSLQVFCIYQDRNDNLWVGTDQGISIFNPYKEQLEIIRHQAGNPNSLPNIDINCIIETSNGEILVGTWGGGVTVFDTLWNFKRHITFAGGEWQNQIWSFLQHDDGTIWIGTQAGYLHIYDPMLKTYKTLRPPELNYATIRQMAKDKEGNILLGLGNEKVAIWKMDDKLFYPYNDEEDLGLLTHGTNSLFVDHRNQCWISDQYGLRKYSQERRIYTDRYNVPKAGRIGQITNGIEAYNDSLFLVGTVHSGLQLFNTRTLQFKSYLTNQLAPYTTITAIKKDHAGNIWFATEYNLFKVNQKEEVVRIDLPKKVALNSMGLPWFYELNDGRWVVATFSELICFNPEDYSSTSSGLDIHFSGFKIFDKDIHIDSFIAQPKPLVLRHHQNFFSIEFANLQYNDLRSIRYDYRLSDVDPDWVSTETPVAEYTDIQPGEYIFEVRAEQGSEFSPVIQIPIIIHPPWWGTWWFRALLLLLISGAVLYAYRRRIQSIRHEANLKHRMMETEMMALRVQMNPHFIFNCINGIDAMIHGDDKYKATMYLNKFAKLIRNVLETSKENKVPLSLDLETLKLYLDLEMFRHPDTFTFELQADNEVMENDYEVPPLIIQPYVENAILHGLRHRPGHEGKLFIRVSRKGNYIHYLIEDNGVGRRRNPVSPEKKFNGVGMQLSDDRVRLFNEEEFSSVRITDLDINGTPAGTRVEVQLKIQ